MSTGVALNVGCLSVVYCNGWMFVIGSVDAWECYALEYVM